MAIKQCSKCGVDFGCTSPVAGCWCEQYNVPLLALSHLRDKYNDCLCPGCLSGYAAGNKEEGEAFTNED